MDVVADDARCAAQLARLLEIDRSAITRALHAAELAGRPLPPFTRDPDTGRRAFATSAFLLWWEQTPRRGRPRTLRS